MRKHRQPVPPVTRARARGGPRKGILLSPAWLVDFLTAGGAGGSRECPDCDVALVLPGAEGGSPATTAGAGAPVPGRATPRGSIGVARQGAGTRGWSPSCGEALDPPRVRLDADQRGGQGTVGARLLAEFAEPGSGDPAGGTQMVAKGHDLPDVTVAGAVNADAPAAARRASAPRRAGCCSLIVQLAGRAGGGAGGPARVFVQILRAAGPGRDARRAARGGRVPRCARSRGGGAHDLAAVRPPGACRGGGRVAPRPSRRRAAGLADAMRVASRPVRAGCWARRRCTGCGGASASSSWSRRPSARPRDRGGRRRRRGAPPARPRATATSTFSVDVDPAVGRARARV